MPCFALVLRREYIPCAQSKPHILCFQDKEWWMLEVLIMGLLLWSQLPGILALLCFPSLTFRRSQPLSSLTSGLSKALSWFLKDFPHSMENVISNLTVADQRPLRLLRIPGPVKYVGRSQWPNFLHQYIYIWDPYWVMANFQELSIIC
jgi:hypothetical protein